MQDNLKLLAAFGQVVKALVELGADVRASIGDDEESADAFAFAEAHHHPEVVRYLRGISKEPK